jgi:heme oxygenase (biliverdin-IX-beta and delta-forming)
MEDSIHSISYHPRTVLFDVLRQRTAPLHDRIEQAVDLPSRCGSIAGYRALLVQLLAFYRPIESHLAAFDWPAVGLDFDERRKAGLLRADLAALGLTPAQIDAAEACPAVPRPATLAEAIGCLYVLEGATLGGQVISRQVRVSLGITPANGGSFHFAYGDRGGAMWRAFREAASRYCGDDHRLIEAAVTGAAATFLTLTEWLSAGTVGGQSDGRGEGK